MNFDIGIEDIKDYNTCPCCSSSEIELLNLCNTREKITFLATSVCKRCGHVYRSKVPSEGWFNEAFRLRFEEQQKQGFNPLNPEIEQQRYDRYHAIGNFINANANRSGNSLLDVGCGPGTGLDAFRDLGFGVVGVDPDESRASVAIEKGHNIHVGEFLTFENENKFDVITLIHSLEHFQNPEFFLKKATEHAHDKTLFYIEVPEVLDHVFDWNDALYLAHISNFNDVSLENLAARCGWKLIDRVNPYENTTLHQGHLAMIFRLSDTQEVPVRQASDNLIDSIRMRYFNGLPDVDTNNHTELTVKEVNDISLGYKGIHDLKKNVHDNYANRNVTHTHGNSYYID